MRIKNPYSRMGARRTYTHYIYARIRVVVRVFKGAGCVPPESLKISVFMGTCKLLSAMISRHTTRRFNEI